VSGKRYAQAIFELAAQRGQLDQWGDDLRFVDQTLQNDEFRLFLSHADVPVAEKIKAISNVFQSVDGLVKNLVALLVTRGLVNLFQDVRAAYDHLLDEHRGRQPVEVTSAVPLNDHELERVSKFVSGLIRKEVVVSTRVDETILGGLIIQVGDQLLDGSTHSRLEELRRRIHSDATASGV
jgi:F-type H+-transporting ATPase subunit delta